MISWLKNIAVFLIPVYVLVLTYLILDPFRVVGELEASKIGPVASSDDYYTVERFLHNLREKNSYNTYVFGNSKTLAFSPESVCREVECSYFNFGAPGESIRNIRDKLKLILEQGQELNLALIVLDHKILINENNAHPDFKGPVYEHHPKVSQKSWIEFHMSFLKYYVRDFFFYDFIKWKFTNTWENSYQGKISRPESLLPSIYNPIQNFTFRTEAESRIRQSPTVYFESVQSEMRRAEAGVYKTTLSDNQLNMLVEIRKIFIEQESDFCIILGPYWNKNRISKEIVLILKDVFGDERVFDFTGENRWNSDMHLWYESNHYRPEVGADILNDIRFKTSSIL